MIDPSYEEKQDYERVIQALRDALTRFAGQSSDSVEALLACDNEVRAFCRQKLA